jgi:hypothetical protein
VRLSSGRRALAFGAAVAGATIYLCFSYGSWDEFGRSIDFNRASFEDFSGPYYATGRSVFETGAPASGFYYSPFFAILLGALVRVQGEASAWTWLAIELAGALGLAWLAIGLARVRSAWGIAAGTFLVLTSFPLVHNFHWGQVSALLVVLELAALRAWQRDRDVLAAALLALAAAIKFHPALLFLPFVGWRDRRSVRYGALWLFLLLVACPALVLGPGRALDFYRELAVEVSSARSPAGAWADAPNEQYLPSVVARLALPAPAALLRVLAIMLGFALVAIHVWLVSRLERRSPRALALAFVLLWLSTPLVVPPSWPHYFAFLPACQIFLACELARERPRGWPAATLAIGISTVLASLPFFRAIGDPALYGRLGFLLCADLLLLPAAYLAIGVERRSSGLARDRDQAQADGNR